MRMLLDEPCLSVNSHISASFASIHSETGFSGSFVVSTVTAAEPETTQNQEPCNGIIRWYDPVTGRWLSKDPIGISGGLNQYVFCGNNPVNSRDPLGLKTYLITVADDPRSDQSYHYQSLMGMAFAYAELIRASDYYNKECDQIRFVKTTDQKSLFKALNAFNDKMVWAHLAHGAEEWIRVGGGFGISPGDVASIPTGGFAQGGRVVILSCFAAATEDGIAQQLANHFNRPVWASGAMVCGIHENRLPYTHPKARIQSWLEYGWKYGGGFRWVNPRN